MSQHRYIRSPATGPRRFRDYRQDLDSTEVTEIIPFNEFGDLDDLDFSHNSVFTVEAQVLRAPELDDLHDTDDLTPLPLQPPGECDADRGLERGLDLDFDRGRDQDLDCRTEPYRYRLQERLTASGVIGAPWRGGQHRRQQLAGAVKSRVLITAMAAGAAAAAAHSATHHPGTTKAETVLAASTSTLGRTAASEYPRGMQMITVKSAANTAVHNEELAKGMAFAQERAQREARLRQPLFVMPTRGAFTSGFGYRWGVLHAGIDIANSIGTPIVAVSDGVVVDAGPTAGYGMWVKLRHADGTVTLYGHVNTTTVNVGQRVMAGDQIATMGNRGNSTGPHLHFEVLQGGTERIDPVPWLAARGLSLGNIAG